ESCVDDGLGTEARLPTDNPARARRLVRLRAHPCKEPERAAAATGRRRTIHKRTDRDADTDPLTGWHASRQSTATDGDGGTAQGAARRPADGTPLDHVHPRFLTRLRGCLDPYLAPQQAAVALGDGLVVVLAPADPLA